MELSMSKQPPDLPTAVTKISNKKRNSDHPTMSFTAVTSHKAMAEAFVEQLTRAAAKIIPDRPVTAEDIVKVCQLALQDKPDQSITMVGGRHLRARVSDQVSRAKRYNEPFSLVILDLSNLTQKEEYDSVVDTLRERMRQTDLLFLFKYRIALLLPHTEESACKMLVNRIQSLIGSVNIPSVNAATLTYPHAEITRTSEVLDWAENALRS